MRSLGIRAIVALWALVTPLPTRAQCPMMGGGGHDHAAHNEETARPTRSQKKLQQTITRILADDEGRKILADALLSDPAFMEPFLQRLATVPEWRSFGAQLVSAVGQGSLGLGHAPLPPVAHYRCPMHPEVNSIKPGQCPKCGMTLVRAPYDEREGASRK